MLINTPGAQDETVGALDADRHVRVYVQPMDHTDPYLNEGWLTGGPSYHNASTHLSLRDEQGDDPTCVKPGLSPGLRRLMWFSVVFAAAPWWIPMLVHLAARAWKLLPFH